MDHHTSSPAPTHCPVCHANLVISRLHCPSCGTEVTGSFSLARLASLQEPYASLIELFLRVRGNMKEMERELGLSYPTVRARLEEALVAAGFSRDDRQADEDLPARRAQILDELERGEISALEAAARLRELKTRRTP
ncbi:MAG: DUF2089 domain-containing protein [Chloroflexi bacterium]|nr:DUF2089 domain-containing protein [Chloroflexota bacterium]